MANDTNFFGLKPYRYLNGSPWNGAVRKFYVSANYATAIRVGDIVDLDPTAANRDPSGKCMTVEVAGNGTLGDNVMHIGVVVSIVVDPSNLGRTHIPASTGGYVNVCCDPNVTFIVRDDGAGAPLAGWVGANATFTYAAGTGDTGLSGIKLDSTTPAADASFECLVLGLADIPNNELDDYAVWEVILNRHRFQSNAGTGNTGMLGLAIA